MAAPLHRRQRVMRVPSTVARNDSRADYFITIVAVLGVAILDEILNKPDRLTPSEFETMKTHVAIGAGILAEIDFPFPVVPFVRYHHEGATRNMRSCRRSLFRPLPSCSTRRCDSPRR
jgi:hypothetical protein